MYISQTIAKTIVDEIGEEIHENINFMDNTGVIIASTDSTRIGVLHEGAKRIIEEGLSELYITPQMENNTTKTGINLPIIIEDKVVGVIGITGERDRVEPFGNIVRRITEILLEDSISKEERRFDRRVRYRFIESWLKEDSTTFSKAMIEKGKRLNIDIEKPRRIMMFQVEDVDILSYSLEGQKLLERIETRIRHIVDGWDKALYLREPRSQLCILPVLNARKLAWLAEEVRMNIQNEFGKRVFAGVDGHEHGSKNVHKLCLEAGRALEVGVSYGNDITCFNELDIEIFMGDIAEESKREYISKLFEGLDEQQLEYYMCIIQEYFNHEGSIGAIADALFMHKNTLQYKLKKLEEITGKDIRTPSGAAVYFMALYFYNSEVGDFLTYRNLSKK